jgi:IS5 family transposase
VRRTQEIDGSRPLSPAVDAEFNSPGLGRIAPAVTQPKRVTHPTDAKLTYRPIGRLGALPRAHDVSLRQTYVRVGKRAQIMAGRSAHAKQLKRANRELHFLRTRLGRLICDILRKTGHDPALQEVFAIPHSRAGQVRR